YWRSAEAVGRSQSWKRLSFSGAAHFLWQPSRRPLGSRPVSGKARRVDGQARSGVYAHCPRRVAGAERFLRQNCGVSPRGSPAARGSGKFRKTHTAMKTTYSTITLRYLHDVVTGEFANIGVVLYSPEQRFLE